MLCKQFNKSAKDPWFKLFYDKNLQAKIDSSIGSFAIPGMYYGRAKDVANNAFTNDYLRPYMVKASEGETVGWKKLSDQYQKKFRKDFVEENILNAQVQVYYYLNKKDSAYRPEYFRLQFLQWERYPWDTTAAFIEGNNVNNFLWDVFIYSSNKQQLLTGAKWMEGIIRRNPSEANEIDTYANLLYKAGKTTEAIEWEQKALQLANTVKDQAMYQNNLRKNLDKMLKGEPTWADAN
jgi:hypothetical protein